MEYQVAFEIDVDADTPRDAARLAWRLLSDDSSLLPVATVRSAEHGAVDIDLNDDAEEDSQ